MAVSKAARMARSMADPMVAMSAAMMADYWAATMAATTAGQLGDDLVVPKAASSAAMTADNWAATTVVTTVAPTVATMVDH